MNPNEINPYAAPQSNVASALPADIHDQPSAGGGKRFLNFIIDRIAVMGVLFVVGVCLAVLENLGVIHGFVSRMEDINALEDILYTAVFSIGYYTFFEGFFGRSLGKLITGTKVVTVSGAPLTFGNAFMRSLSRIVPFEPFSFLGSGVDTGWHDSWTSTRVVDLRAAPVPKPRPMTPGQMPRMYTPPQPPR